MKNESIAIQYCINIPEDATNGDVIKALFPNVSMNYLIVNMERNSWLNAKYKAESED